MIWSLAKISLTRRMISGWLYQLVSLPASSCVPLFHVLLFPSTPAASPPRICAPIVARETHLASAGAGGFDDDIDEDFDEEDEMGIARMFVRL